MAQTTLTIAGSTACLAGQPLDAAIDKIRNLGFPAIGLSAFSQARNRFGEIPGFCFDDQDEEEREDLKSRLVGFGGIVTHAPYEDIALFSTNAGVRREAQRQIREAMEAAWFYGSGLVTVRLAGRSMYSLGEYRDEVVRTLQDLGDFAEGCGLMLGIETGFPESLMDYAMLFLDIDHDAVGASVHLGRLGNYLSDPSLKSEEPAARYNEMLMRLVTTLGSEICHIQLGDTHIGPPDAPAPLRFGAARLEPVLAFLSEAFYDGMVEITPECGDGEELLAENQAYVEGLMERRQC